MVHTRNPVVVHQKESKLHYVAIVRAGEKTEPEIACIGFSAARNVRQEFQTKYPDCWVELVEQIDLLPGIDPHIVISSPRFEDVVGFRNKFHERMGRIIILDDDQD